MAKVNHRDTLDTSLRELQRRLRLLEARHAALSAVTNPAFAASSATTPAFAAAQFVPSRPADWWQLADAEDWTELATATTAATTVRLWADGPGTVRVQVDGQPDAEFTAGQHDIAVTGGVVRIQGRGTIRVFATLA